MVMNKDIADIHCTFEIYDDCSFNVDKVLAHNVGEFITGKYEELPLDFYDDYDYNGAKVRRVDAYLINERELRRLNDMEKDYLKFQEIINKALKFKSQ